jgi:hypothetical protein
MIDSWADFCLPLACILPKPASQGAECRVKRHEPGVARFLARSAYWNESGDICPQHGQSGICDWAAKAATSKAVTLDFVLGSKNVSGAGHRATNDLLLI